MGAVAGAAVESPIFAKAPVLASPAAPVGTGSALAKDWAVIPAAAAGARTTEGRVRLGTATAVGDPGGMVGQDKPHVRGQQGEIGLGTHATEKGPQAAGPAQGQAKMTNAR